MLIAATGPLYLIRFSMHTQHRGADHSTKCDTGAHPHLPCTLSSAPKMLRKWVSRFDLWPYVEQYTLDVQREIMAGARGAGVVMFVGLSSLLS
jgi:hypothetical protein